MSDPTLIQLRPVSDNDLPVLADVGRRTFLESFLAYNDPDNIDAYLAQAFSDERLRRDLETDGVQTLLLWVDGVAAGYLKLNMGDAQTETRGDAALEVERVYLLADFQGRGLGRSLMQFALDAAQATGKSCVWLGVWEHNQSAIAFYERLGFTIVGEHSFMLGTEKQRDIIMEVAVPRQT